MQIYKSIFPLLFISAISSTVLVSCGGNDASQGAQQKKVLPYNTIQLQRSTATLFAEYPAKLQGAQDIDIRPKIDGYIEKVHIDEGAEVRAGQVLFTINNPQYLQDVNNATAAIASAEASVSAASLQVRKTKPLVDQGIISAFELENAELNLKAQQATLAQRKAAYNNAKINLGYTTVTSPVSGVVGVLPYRVGSYVNSATTQPLTTVSDISKIFAYFSINEKQQLSFVENTPGANFQSKINQVPEVDLVLSNGDIYPHKGKVQTFSGQVDAATGSFNVRASFPNEARILRSGSSASIRIPTEVKNAIIIPQNATTELQDKRMAYIVGDSNKVKAVVIQVRPIPGGKYFVVDEGLKDTDKLIIEGIGIITEGMTIEPKLVDADSAIQLLKSNP